MRLDHPPGYYFRHLYWPLVVLLCGLRLMGVQDGATVDSGHVRGDEVTPLIVLACLPSEGLDMTALSPSSMSGRPSHTSS